MPVWIVGIDGSSYIALAAENAPEPMLRALETRLNAPPMLILSHARAATLKMRLYTAEVVAVVLAKAARADHIRAIADPSRDMEFPMKGPFDTKRESPGLAAIAGVKLAKLAGLLPAVVVFAAPKDAALADLARVEASDVLSFDEAAARDLTIVTRARVPLEGAEDAELVAFRAKDGGPEHYAVVIGDISKTQSVLTRLHSECFTGDLLGSLRCDCGDQLRGAIKEIGKAGGGVLLYLAQEGRGIGLMNKLRAYRLQDEGFDTMQANERLGFAADERLFDTAARMLTLLGVFEVRLMTNNPEKMRQLEKAGVKVRERVAHAFPSNEHNRDYLRTKSEKGGHLL